MSKRKEREEEVGWILTSQKRHALPDPSSKQRGSLRARSERRLRALLEDEVVEGVVNFKRYRARFLTSKSSGWSRWICVRHEQALNVVFELGQRLFDPASGFPVSTVSLAATLVKRCFASDMLSDAKKACPSLPFACYNLAMKMLETELMNYDDYERLNSQVTPRMVIEMEELVGSALGWAIKRVTACEVLEELLVTCSRAFSKQWRSDLVWFTVWVSAFIDVDALPSTVVTAALACVARKRGLRGSSDLSWVIAGLRPSDSVLAGRPGCPVDDAVMECVREMLGKAPIIARRWAAPTAAVPPSPGACAEHASPTNDMDSLDAQDAAASSSSSSAAAAAAASTHCDVQLALELGATIAEPGPLMARLPPAQHLHAVAPHDLSLALGPGLFQVAEPGSCQCFQVRS